MMIALRASINRLGWRYVLADATYVSFLALLCLIFFWRLITPFVDERMFIAEGDFTHQFYPYRFFLASELHSGRLPLWNPYIFAGHPVLADTQVSITYPLALLFALVSGINGLTLEGAELEAIVHYFIAMVFMYFFAKRLTLHRPAAVVSAIAFAFSGYLLSYPGQQVPILETAVWLPLITLFIHRSTESSRAWIPNLCFAGASQALAVLAGHPQTAMFLMYTSVLYLVYLSIKARYPLSKVFLGAICFISISLAISAAQLLPALEFIPMSTRAQLSYEDASHGFEFSSALGIFLPDWRNEKSLYVGVIPVILAILAVWRRAPDYLFWGGIACVSLLLSFGGRTALFPILFAIVPGFSMFKDQERIAIVFVFSLAVLAGHGFAWIGGREGAIRKRLRGLITVLAVPGFAALMPFVTSEWSSSSSFLGGSYGSVVNGYQLFLALLFSSSVLLILVALGRIRRTTFTVLVFGLVIADLLVVNWSNNIVPQASSTRDDAFATMEYLRQRPDIFRIRVENDQVLPSNYPGMFGVAHIGGDTPIAVRRVRDLLDFGNEWKIWQLFNVEYVITLRQFTQGVELVNRVGALNTYKVSFGLPRAYAVTRFAVAENESEALGLTLSEKNHPGDLVVLEEQPSFVSPAEGVERPLVTIVEHSPARIKIATKGDVDSLLVVADTYYPGWSATIDGTPAKIYVANYAFRAVELPKGEHLVQMVYVPSTFYLGAAISLIGWAVVAVFAFFSFRSLLARR